jgi:hypothetical protein
MGRLTRAFVGAGAVALSLSYVQQAEAAPMPKGTLAVGVDRLVASNFHIGNGFVLWDNQFFGAPGWEPFDTPRLGIDYFIIDGLSIGGHLGMGFYAVDNNDGAYVAILPRIGYAFSLSNVIDFWPRGGVGIVAGDYADDTGFANVEAMFLANIKDYFAISFGPAIDIPFGRFYQDVVLGANAGIVVKF